ncbi:MAG TPA: hypothetical protein VEP68_10200 [Anaeromyxobacteraceae bacterium]|nr:hypothetical protein [Anaeromyxobacteraceae bacterium]
MRTLALAAALLSTGCVVHYRYGALAPEQAVPGQPFGAQAEGHGVRVVAHAGDWQGWPENVEDRLTPVAVTVENRSGKALRLGPDAFGLLDPGGFRHRALTTPEVQREFAWLGGWGWYGWYGWYGPWPYAWWGWPPYGPYPGPWGGYWYGQPSPPPGRVEGTLQDGGRFTAWVFFPVPTASLPRFDLLLRLVDDASGKPFGAVRLSFLREGERWPPPLPAGVPPPPPGAPPPPGKTPPPPAEKAPPAPEKAAPGG